jgi:hypothetical protein
MKAVLIQTSDPVEYAVMLASTSRTTREFCRRHGLEYRDFVGIKNGFWAWHSTYNRIHMMNELLEEGYGGWLLYLDADAYVFDLEFPIAEYLAAHQQSAMIGVRASAAAEYWDINAGVLFLNLNHSLARTIVQDMNRRLEEAVRGSDFLSDTWPALDLLMDDQGILNCALIQNPEWQSAVHYEHQSLMNSMHASFIRHRLRSNSPDASERLKLIQAEVEDVMSGHVGDSRTTAGLKGLITAEIEDLGGAYQISGAVNNIGQATWLRSGSATGSVNIGVILRRPDGRRNQDFQRIFFLDRSAPAGSVCKFKIEISKDRIGDAEIHLNLVSEHITWFAEVSGTQVRLR